MLNALIIAKCIGGKSAMSETTMPAPSTAAIPPPTVKAADLVKIRNARNWKRSHLAAYLGCNYTTVWRMEHGKISIDGAHQRLLALLMAEGVTP
jgi:DNA-binding transcriptional regulator YiaG